MNRLLARIPVIWQETLFAGVLCVLDLRIQWAADQKPWIGQGPVPWPIVVACGALGYSALVWRRQRPLLVFGILVMHSVVAQVFVQYRPLFGLLVAFYTVVSRASLRWSFAALGALIVPSALMVVDEVINAVPEEKTKILVANLIVIVVVDGAAWGVGRWVGESRRSMVQLEIRREVEARKAVAAERQRIARELHDIIAHSVTVMVLQASGARRLAAPELAQLTRVLTDIEGIGRQAIGELRRLLGVLVSSGLQTGADELGPLPGLADLPAAIERIARAGLAVDTLRHGVARQLDPSVEVAAYRVVAEGLTNAMKHGGAGTRATVELTWRPEEFLVSVTNDGHGRPRQDALSLSSGRGLAGLGERVHAVGGRFDSGYRDEGGFAISAALPVTGGES